MFSTQSDVQQQPTIRLRDNPPPITPSTRPSRKRKSPPNNNQDSSQSTQHVLPPPHSLVHPMQGPPPLPPGYAYAPTDYTPGGIPHPHSAQLQHPSASESQQDLQSSSSPATGRALSNSKRAEQNRKAQRAFRERRDQSVSPFFWFWSSTILTLSFLKKTCQIARVQITASRYCSCISG